MEPEGSSPHHKCTPPFSTPRLSVWLFRNKICFYGEELSAPSPTPKSGGPPLVSCPRLLTQYIRSYPPYWWPFLHPQREDASCRGDRKL